MVGHGVCVCVCVRAFMLCTTAASTAVLRERRAAPPLAPLAASANTCPRARAAHPPSTGTALAGILAVLVVGGLDMKATLAGKQHYLLYCLTPAMTPRMLMTGAWAGTEGRGEEGPRAAHAYTHRAACRPACTTRACTLHASAAAAAGRAGMRPLLSHSRRGELDLIRVTLCRLPRACPLPAPRGGASGRRRGAAPC